MKTKTARKSGKSNIIINALAGTGKSFLLVQLVREFAQEQGRPTLCIAFAKRDKEVLDTRLAPLVSSKKAKVYTSNGGGMAILSNWARNQGKGRQLEVNNNADNQILWQRWVDDKHIIQKEDKIEWKEPAHLFFTVLALVEKARTVMLLRANDPKYPKAPTDDDFRNLADRFDMEIDNDSWPTVLFYAQWLFTQLCSLENMLIYGVDYAGQVFLPVYHQLTPPQIYSIVLVDEGQDQNPPNRELAFMFAGKDGSVIVVGDQNQGIYTWRGAEADAMEQWAKRMQQHSGKAPETFPLTLCRRCSKAVIRQAQYLVPAIQALPEAKEGEDRHLENEGELFSELSTNRKGLVLCRANAPLVSLALKLLAKRVKAALLRSNNVGDLLRLIDKLSNYNSDFSVVDLLGKVTEWQTEQLAKLAKRKNGAATSQVVNDKAACIHALSEENGITTVWALKQKINELFPHNPKAPPPNPAEMVVLSTIHGAKGGEAHTVYLLSPDDRKGNIFDEVWSGADDRDHTLYVGQTRAEFALVYVGRTKPTLLPFYVPPMTEEDCSEFDEDA